jgi:hypothetical protein
MADDVQLVDLEVVQLYSLALRETTAPRDEVIAALEADLDWLTGDSRRPSSADDGVPPRRSGRGSARTPAGRRTREA